jgi:hypothetical protein
MSAAFDPQMVAGAARPPTYVKLTVRSVRTLVPGPRVITSSGLKRVVRLVYRRTILDHCGTSKPRIRAMLIPVTAITSQQSADP